MIYIILKINKHRHTTSNYIKSNSFGWTDGFNSTFVHMKSVF